MSTTNVPLPPSPAPPPPPTPTAKADSESRWALVREINDHPNDQGGLWLMLGLWLVAVFLAMVAVSGGNPFSVPALLAFAFELLALLLMLGLWSSLNTGVLLAVHAPLACLSVLQGPMATVGVVSVAIMFGAAEAGQNWWSVVADHQEDGATIIEPPNRTMAAFEVVAIAGAAAILVGMFAVVESRVATVAAIGLFVVLGIGAVMFRRRD